MAKEMSVLRSSIQKTQPPRRSQRDDTVDSSVQLDRRHNRYRKLVHRQLSALRTGSLVVREAGTTTHFGDAQAGLSATLTVHDAGFYRSAVLGGSLGAAESYLAGEWQTDDLLGVLRVMAQNRQVLEQINGGRAVAINAVRRVWNWSQQNSRSGSRRNIAAHYDLGNEFFRLFLDPTMTYSSGLFDEPTSSMLDASLAKYDRLCQKLQLQPKDHVLEIGTGWGGFAIFAAQRYGCRVTTTTISAEQFTVAKERIEQAGVSDRVTLLNRDYRDLEGQFDKLVSIEMIEAVGHKYLKTFFGQCCELLKPDGMMALQAITIPDQRYDRYRRNVDFIQRHIFPGGCLPSVKTMHQAISAATDFQPIHFETFADHYAKTLSLWRNQFERNLSQIRQLAVDDRFLRAWEYYFCYCEAGFWERQVDVCQLVLAKPECRALIEVPALPCCPLAKDESN